MRIIIWTGEAKIATETVLVCQSLFFSNGLLHFQDQHAGDGSGVDQKQYSEFMIIAVVNAIAKSTAMIVAYLISNPQFNI